MQKQPLMNALSEGYSDSRVDYVINNDGTMEDLRKNIELLVKGLNINK